MSDFVNEFWNLYVVVVVLVGILACAVLLIVQGKATFTPGKTMGHVWDGDLEEYKNWLETRRATEETKTKPAAQQKQSLAAAKPNKKSLLSKQSKLETALANAQQELSEINRRLADPATYANCPREEIDRLNAVYSTLEKKIADLEESWLELESALEE